ncbi:helix-turn-helix domain-containing protein [Clostridium botulinum]|uniref:helix-turn-helix domain-containing protein n=1 Tax=Clostridium botulinum TaxID=1491 RepID=UPI000D37F345|nr:helix-turn-helix transcriptional regulator [Clostridium botulinum]AWB31557.1 XRE family transcriptional regulator [Clostridium botulinum]MBY6829209.1 helix-turn-helix transcriptional regulator [Clostridium botulinum]MBY6844833.1 helix-turn-helix transcriptional regulator [Clostridium botulinum]MBY6941457.1 helix-turn-helix transcriptional regulator [Clostridium botulinum]MBY6962328.1 helix-turn-helix transcriptional regulator [Clostridium botulinum]
MNKIKIIRNKLGLSVYKIAELTGLTPSYISNLENGYKTNPTKDVMDKISTALGQTVPEVFYPKDEKEA